MSLLPAFIKTRKRNDDSAAAAADSDAIDSHNDEPGDNVFTLLPPDSDTAAPETKPQGRDHHPVDMTDLSRLSIDRDGWLYWDGKPVEVHRRFSMSRGQIIAASIVTMFIVIGALGAALQGAVAARDLACRFGWSVDACSLAPSSRSDIPA